MKTTFAGTSFPFLLKGAFGIHDGQVDSRLCDIIISAIEIDEMDMFLVNPLASDETH